MTENEKKNEVFDDIGSWNWVEQVEKHVPATSAAELMEMTIAPRPVVRHACLLPILLLLQAKISHERQQ